MNKIKDSIKSEVSVELFGKLKYEIIRLKLEPVFEPYQRLNSNIIVFHYEGTFEQIQALSKEWNKIEVEEREKTIQLEYSFFESSIFKINKILNIGFLPIAKIQNKAKTKKYILNNAGLVSIFDQDEKLKFGVNPKNIMINKCSTSHINEFVLAIEKIA